MSPLFSWGARNEERLAPRPSSRIVETLSSSRALPRFISAIGAHPTPVLLDLGPVVGANVAFFGERLSCKMLIEDLHQDVEAATKKGSFEGLADIIIERITKAVSEPVHGVLCWDIFDYLDRATAKALGNALAKLVQPRGALHGLFGARAATLDYRTKYIVESESSIRCRREPAAAVHRHALQTGEVSRLFPGLSIVESVLLQNNTREALFRKT